DGRRLPHRRAPVLPDVAVLRPGLMAALAGAGDRVEGPNQLSGLRVERLDATAHADLGAREARDNEPVVVQRRVRERKTLLPALRLNRPYRLAGFLVEREQLAVELAHEHLAGAETDTAARP